MRQTVRVGIIGTGDMGGQHARNLAGEVPAASVAAIMDVDQARAQEIADACGGAQVYGNAERLIQAGEIDAVVIAAPDRFHAELARACIAAGKPVLCEKPLATNAQAARTVIDAEVAAGRRLVQLGFMREYDPAHVRVKQAVAQGEVGQLLAFRGVHINPTKGTLRQVDEVIFNSAIHDIHSARWLMGQDVVRVFTSYIPGSIDQPQTARFVLIQLEFASGALGTIECNAESGYGYEVDVKVTGEIGSVETNALTSAILRKNYSRSLRVDADWLSRFETAYLNEERAWVRSIQAGQPTGPSAWDGYVAMLIADACTESARTGLPVAISVPPKPGIYD